MEPQLINNNDVQTYRRIDPKYSQEKFNGFLQQVQQRNLRDFLGGALYEDLMSNFSVAKYQTLLNGETYTYNNKTIRFYGIKPMLVYHWLTIATREGSLFHTGYGAVDFTNNIQQNFNESKEKERIALEYLDMAVKYQNDTIQFLDEKYATYPLWEGKEQKSGVQFTMFKV